MGSEETEAAEEEAADGDEGEVRFSDKNAVTAKRMQTAATAM